MLPVSCSLVPVWLVNYQTLTFNQWFTAAVNKVFIILYLIYFTAIYDRICIAIQSNICIPGHNLWLVALKCQFRLAYIESYILFFIQPVLYPHQILTFCQTPLLLIQMHRDLLYLQFSAVCVSFKLNRRCRTMRGWGHPQCVFSLKTNIISCFLHWISSCFVPNLNKASLFICA